MIFSKIKDVLKGLKSLATGLGITGRAFCAKKVTVIYPQEEVDNLSTFRGMVELIGKEDAPEEPMCAACGNCAKACPSNCITILCPIPAQEGEAAQMGPAPQKGARAPGRFIMDFSLCCLCGQCIGSCARNGLQFSNDPYVVSFNRKDFQFDLLKRLHSQAHDRSDSDLPKAKPE